MISFLCAMRWNGLLHMLAVAANVLILAARASAAPPSVSVVIGSDAPALEKLAAEEVAEHLRLLYDARPEIVTARPADPTPTILVGTPATNAAIKEVLGDAWPKLSPQGQTLKSVASSKGAVLVVGGGSPIATFWAASEFGHRMGIRSILMGNFAPVEKPDFTLANYDVVIEPLLSVRAWTLMDATPIGPAAWGLEEHKRFLRQLARMKFNRIVLEVQPWQPFVAWSFEGTKKTSDTLWPGGPIKVDGDTGGRAAFRGAALFDNPDLAEKKSAEDRIQAGIALLRGIIKESHRYGMTVALAVPPFEFPKEFAEKLTDSSPSTLSPDLAVIPGDKTPLAGPEAQKLALAQLRAYVETYPALDVLVLNTTFDWEGPPEPAWRRLQQTGTIAATATLQQVVDEAENRKGLLSGDEGALAIRAQVAAIPALRILIENPDLPKRKGKSELPVELAGVDPALARLGLRITPGGAGVLFLPEVSDKAKPNANAPAATPLKLTANIDWSDPLVGVLPRFHTKATAAALSQLRANKWAGFTINAPIASGLDPTAYYVARAAFDSTVTPENSLRDLVDHVAGPGLADRVLKGFTAIELATDAVEIPSIELGVPDSEIFSRHLLPQHPPEWWAKVRDANLEAMNEMYRANTRAREGGRAFTLYYARKFEFGFETMNALEAMRLSSVAADEKQSEKQIEQLEKAIESMYGGLNACAAVAGSPSDRGVIALLNEHAYRFLKKELMKTEDEK